MRLLFLVFYGFSESNGISKKIRYQIDALRQGGLDVRTCYYEVRPDGHRCWMVDGTLLADLGSGLVAKLRKRMDFSPILHYMEREEIEAIYIRTYHNANPFTIRLVKRLKTRGIDTILEIPTYPYDQEYQSRSEKLQLAIDRLFRHRFCRYIDRIVTFSDDTEIFGRPTLRISNGIDFRHIALRRDPPSARDGLHLIAVAEIHFWHGLDRLVEGLGRYYSHQPDYPVYVHLVGPLSGPREEQEILTPLHRYGLEQVVILHGPMHGAELDALFDRCHLAIGSLGRHRSGITSIKTLKNREYAARGFAFVYSESDADFDHQPYVWKVPADESPIDIAQLVEFYRQQSLSPPAIRSSIAHLAWSEQMQPIVQYLLSAHRHE